MLTDQYVPTSKYQCGFQPKSNTQSATVQISFDVADHELPVKKIEAVGNFMILYAFIYRI